MGVAAVSLGRLFRPSHAARTAATVAHANADAVCAPARFPRDSSSSNTSDGRAGGGGVNGGGGGVGVSSHVAGASHDGSRSHAAAVKFPAEHLAADATYPRTHVGSHDEPLESVAVQSPKSEAWAGSAEASHGSGSHVATDVSVPAAHVVVPFTE